MKKWLVLCLSAVVLAGIGLGIFLLTDRPEKKPRQTAALEAVVETVLPGDQLEVQVLDTDYTGMLIISVKGLDIPVLTKGDRILLTYDPADSLSDGYLETVFELAEVEEPPVGYIDRLEKHVEGMVISLDENSLQLQTEDYPAAVYRVNLEGFSLDLKRGDVVMVHYYPGEDPYRIEEVTGLNRTEEADFGVRLDISEATATGLRLEIRIESDLPLTTTDDITLKTADWKPVKSLPGGAFPGETYPLTEGVFTVDWSQVYGQLEPGQYYFYKPIYYEDRELIHAISFAVDHP